MNPQSQTEAQIAVLADQLTALADHLTARRGAVLEAWRATVNRDPDLTSGSSLSRALFNDHIPEILDSFARRLQAWPNDITVAVKRQENQGTASHGLHRWQQGFRLRELTREWGYLQLCLVEEVETYATSAANLDSAAVAIALRELMQLCLGGVSESAEQYWQLQQAEAAGRLRELERALGHLNEIENARAAGWHEAAHDLRGSVTVVKLATTLLHSDSVPEDMRDHAIGILESSVSSLHDMLNSLIDLARLEAGHEHRVIAPFDAAVLAADFCLTMQPVASAQGLYLKYEGPPSMPVLGDQTKIRRIFQNLVLNALKYTREGGINVAWCATEETDANHWMVTVQDTGPGFEGDTGVPMAKRLREATQSAHRVEDDALADGTSYSEIEHAVTLPSQSPQHPLHQQAGEGIGLSIVKELCDLLDATLELETGAGRGSTFRVTFPCKYDQ